MVIMPHLMIELVPQQFKLLSVTALLSESSLQVLHLQLPRFEGLVTFGCFWLLLNFLLGLTCCFVNSVRRGGWMVSLGWVWGAFKVTCEGERVYLGVRQWCTVGMGIAGGQIGWKVV